MKKDEKGKTMESKNTKKTHQKSPDNDNKRTGKTDHGTGNKLIENMNRENRKGKGKMESQNTKTHPKLSDSMTSENKPIGKSDYGIGAKLLIQNIMNDSTPSDKQSKEKGKVHANSKGPKK